MKLSLALAAVAIAAGGFGCHSHAPSAAAPHALAAIPASVPDVNRPWTPPPALPTVSEVVASKVDLWGEAALRQPDGPTFDFFARLLPPIRYVDADFHYYPIVLSAPGSPVKGRLVSNGSCLNALARQPNWRNETGTPVRILVGDDRAEFGVDLTQLQGPKLLDGCIPIVNLSYRHAGDTYGEEFFAAVDDRLASRGAIFCRFTFPAADRGRIELRIRDGYTFLGGEAGHLLRAPDGTVLAAFDDNWAFNRYRCCLTSTSKHGAAAVAVFFTQPATLDDLSFLHASVKSIPAPASAPGYKDTDPPPGPPGELQPPNFRENAFVELTDSIYHLHRAQARALWRARLDSGARFSLPEPYVQSAWRGLIAGTYSIASLDSLNYSASNQYARQYVAEISDSIRSLLLFGHRADAERYLPAILAYSRPRMEYHNAGFKLQLLADYYWITRDADFVRSTRPLWQSEVDRILTGRDPSTGLLPKEKYCGDIEDLVYSLNSDANCWRGLRDMSAVLADVGESAEAEKLSRDAAAFRKVILAAIEKSAVHTTTPPFLPLYPGEDVHDPITATRLGSYWNLMSGYMLGSGVFPPTSPLADDLVRYLQTHGGLCMGMLRVQSARSFWVGDPPLNIDDLYGLRYALTLDHRDEPDRALVSFYGKLAQGMTRDTYEDGESTSIQPLDPFGRQVYLPPNSAANASFLLQLRHLLIQDYDLDDDGRPDTLRLCFATPRAWLADGKEIRVDHAPTAFGPVSFSIGSQLSAGHLSADLSLPDRPCSRILLRFRLPGDYRAVSAAAAGRPLPTAGPDTFDLTALHGQSVSLTASVTRAP